MGILRPQQPHNPNTINDLTQAAFLEGASFVVYTAQMRSLFKSYPHLKPMDKYAKKVAQRLFKKYPLWLPYARIEEHDDQHYLVVAVEAPVNPSKQDLLISTYNHEITICFDRHHVHFDRFQTEVFESAVQNAMNHISKILLEEYIVGVLIEDGKYKMARLYTPQTIERIKPNEISYMRSWLGTFDKHC